MKHFTQKAFIRHAFKMHALIMQTLQATLLSKLAMTCLLTTAGWLTFIGCAPVMDPVAKKAGDGTPTPDPVVDPPAPPGPPLVGPIYVAVGDSGKIALSKDSGSSWEAVASGTTAGLSDIATDGTNIVAVATNGAVVRSTDGGENWSVISSTDISISSTGNSFAEIEYGDGVFSLFTSGSTPLHALYRSTNAGTTWATSTIAPGLFTAVNENIRLAYDGSRFLAVGGGGDTGTIAISTDGLAYTSGLGNGNLNFGAEVLSLRIANGRFFIFTALFIKVGRGGYNTPNIYQAPTGTWGASPWTTNRRTSATDVTTFPAAASNMQINDIAHSGSGGVYAFVDLVGGKIITSPTAIDGSFTLPTSPVSVGLRRIIFFNGKFVAAGIFGKILNGDAAGTTWTEVTSGITDNLLEGEATANKIVFAGTGGKIVVSSDGTTWAVKSAAGNDTDYKRLVLIE